MPRIYRVMSVEGEKPLVANSARGLGVRIGNGPHDDLAATASGEVVPETGGMSVAPSWRDLPSHRIPRRLKHISPDATGQNRDACWQMGEGKFTPAPVAEGLVLRPDGPSHGTVEPYLRISVKDYLHDLGATRDRWMIDES